jgi:hypothetical protein
VWKSVVKVHKCIEKVSSHKTGAFSVGRASLRVWEGLKEIIQVSAPARTPVAEKGHYFWIKFNHLIL